MVSERLREETKKGHLEVEAMVIPKIKNLSSSASYGQLLNMFYGYFRPVEDKISLFVTHDILVDVEERRKAGAILQDIQFIGEQKQKQQCVDLPSITNTATALGAMYVLEGSTLGGVHISKMIATKMNFSSVEGLNFFNGYGSETGSRWTVFKTALDLYANSVHAEDEIVKSANETFEKFKSWIEIS